jgi:hypothetical protein
MKGVSGEVGTTLFYGFGSNPANDFMINELHDNLGKSLVYGGFKGTFLVIPTATTPSALGLPGTAPSGTGAVLTAVIRDLEPSFPSPGAGRRYTKVGQIGSPGPTSAREGQGIDGAVPAQSAA